MPPRTRTATVPIDQIGQSILILRGQRVLLDSDLAALYGVTTKRLNEQVKRNIDRFPEDFMFPLRAQEWDALRSPSSRGHCCPRPSQTRTSATRACGSSLHSFAHRLV
jgi:hypothetical protein